MGLTLRSRSDSMVTMQQVEGPNSLHDAGNKQAQARRSR
jgi:hypothetical protein